jgi:sec-independent protein translocase protein TatA
MGQLGFSEMLVIFIVALLVFGPKKLPELGKSLGKGIREFRKATDELKSTWQDQVKDIQAPLNDVKKDMHEMSQDLKSDFYKSLESSVETEHATHTTTATTAAPEVPHAAGATASASQPAESATPKEHA